MKLIPKSIEETITENGIKKYKNHFCHCKDNNCKERIPYPTNKQTLINHKYKDVPKYIKSHINKGRHLTTTHKEKIGKSHLGKKYNVKQRNNSQLKINKESIIENNVKVYKKHYCHCPCNGRIPYPITVAELNNHKYKKIPDFISGHQNIGSKHSRNTKNKIRKTKLGIHCSQKTKDKISKAHIGKHHSCETIQKMCKLNSGKNNPRYGISPPKSSSYGKRCYYKSLYQGKICFRSTYELAYAKYLDNKNIKWKYEHKTFPLSNGTTYRPDFYLVKKKKYREIKGYMNKKAQEKIDLFQIEYPNKNFKVLFKEDLIKKGIL